MPKKEIEEKVKMLKILAIVILSLLALPLLGYGLLWLFTRIFGRLFGGG
jgi:nitrate reductase NapE component